MVIISRTLIMISISFMLNLSTSNAKNFGTHGASFSIEEEGFIAMLKRRLGSLDIVEHQKKMQALARKRVSKPKPVAGINRAIKTISHSFDPSYILDQDVVLPCGKIMYKAGMIINPLDHMSWDGSLVFLNSEDSEQVDWLKARFLSSNDNKMAKIVLVAGMPLKLEKELNQNIYFDQFGELTAKFNIEHIPAIVEQDGKVLKITEINI